MLASTCPNRERLFDYVVGRLSDETSESVAEHLDLCQPCQAMLATFDDADDTLVARLRSPAGLDGAVGDPYLQESQCSAAVARARAVAGHGDPFGAEPVERDTTPSRLLGELGEYRLLEVLGRGGMGKVYRAMHTKLERVVALKVLSTGRADDDRAIARFEREMKAVGRLEHPHVVHAHDAREIDGKPVLIMEYVEGLDLAKLVRRCGPLPIGDACELARQTALGLQYAHEHGLVHRDVKPSNLMLTPEGQLKILDLGLARFHREQAAGDEVTGTGQAMGTADYMAPEQASDSRTVDIRADIYSLGCTLYKLLCGRAPFSGPEYRGAFEKMTAHVQESVPPIGQFNPDVPGELAAVLDRMLAKDPDQRFAIPAEVADALQPMCADSDLPSLAARAQQDQAADAAPSEPPASGPVPLATARRWKLAAMAVGLALLGVGAGLALGIIITIEHNGQKTQIEISDGDGAKIDGKEHAEGKPANGGAVAPHEGAMITLPPYQIEPPDVLQIDMPRQIPLQTYEAKAHDVLQIHVLGALLEQPINNHYLIDAEGAVNLGPAYGTVRVQGMTIEKVKAAIDSHLRKILKKPQVSVELTRQAGSQPVTGTYVVGPDGTVNLRQYGSVSVTGKTVAEAKAALEKHLGSYFQSPAVFVSVSAYNSKVYYIITESVNLGDNVVRIPITGKEAVLDAISNIGGLSQVSSERIWISRPTPGDSGRQRILHVDYDAITRHGDTRTNYQVLPGDRVFIAGRESKSDGARHQAYQKSGESVTVSPGANDTVTLSAGTFSVTRSADLTLEASGFTTTSGGSRAVVPAPSQATPDFQGLHAKLINRQNRTKGRHLVNQSLYLLHLEAMETNKEVEALIQMLMIDLSKEEFLCDFIAFEGLGMPVKRRYWARPEDAKSAEMTRVELNALDREVFERLAKADAQSPADSDAPGFVERRSPDGRQYHYYQPIYANTKSCVDCHDAREETVRAVTQRREAAEWPESAAKGPAGSGVPVEVRLIRRVKKGDLMAVVQVTFPVAETDSESDSVGGPVPKTYPIPNARIDLWAPGKTIHPIEKALPEKTTFDFTETRPSEVVDAPGEHPRAVVPASEAQAILVAREDIPADTLLTSELLGLEVWPKEKVPGGTMPRIEEIQGRRTRMKIYTGEPILEKKLLADGKPSGAVIPEGYRVVSVKVDRPSPDHDAIMPGDRVDVTLHVLKQQVQGVVDPGAHVFLQDIRVFAVNDVVDVEGDQQELAAKTFSLLVTPEQAKKVTLATEIGDIQLRRRAPTDFEAIQGTWELIRVLHGHPVLLHYLPPVKDVGTEAGKLEGTTQVVITADRFKVLGDHVRDICYEYRVNPDASKDIIEFRSRRGGGSSLSFQGIYELAGDELKVCVAQSYLPEQMWAKYNSDREMFILRRVGPVKVYEDETRIQGRWEVTKAHGCKLPSQQVTIDDRTMVFDEASVEPAPSDASGQERGNLPGSGFRGEFRANDPCFLYVLDPSHALKRIELVHAPHSYLMGAKENIAGPRGRPGVYRLEGDRLTIRLGKDNKRPTDLDAPAADGEVLLELKRVTDEQQPPPPDAGPRQIDDVGPQNDEAAQASVDLFGGVPIVAADLPAMEAAFAKAGLGGYEIKGTTIRVPARRRAAYLATLADAGILPPLPEESKPPSTANESTMESDFEAIQGTRPAEADAAEEEP